MAGAGDADGGCGAASVVSRDSSAAFPLVVQGSVGVKGCGKLPWAAVELRCVFLRGDALVVLDYAPGVQRVSPESRVDALGDRFAKPAF